MDEQRAIDLCLKHCDPVGFEFLVRKYRREAYAHAVALLGNPEDALDACQDAFARAFGAIARLRHLPQFYPWFYTILRHCCLNRLARRHTAERYQQAQRHDPAAGIDSATPSTLVEQAEEQRRLWRALEALSPEHREILIMKYVQEHRYDEIAQLLGIPRGTVMSRLYHARHALRRQLEQSDQPRSGFTSVTSHE